jgi:hypothetical protein
MAPRRSDASVIPSWHADRYASMWSTACCADLAPGLPWRTKSATCVGRKRAIANSDATKSPLAATSASANSSSAAIADHFARSLAGELERRRGGTSTGRAARLAVSAR